MNAILQGWSPPARPTHPRPLGAAVTRLRLHGAITIESAIELFAAIRAAHANSITISIDSAGGNALAAMAIYELLVTHPHRVVADIARASSGAVLVALAADHRYVAPRARLLLHETRADLRDATAGVLRSTLAGVEMFDDIAAKILADATGQAPEQVAAWRRSTVTFSAAEAIRAGLAHEIA